MTTGDVFSKLSSLIQFVFCYFASLLLSLLVTASIFYFKFDFSEIDHLIGCGEKNGMKYFLVRSKGSHENELFIGMQPKNLLFK